MTVDRTGLLVGRRISIEVFNSEGRLPGDYCGPVEGLFGRSEWWVCTPEGEGVSVRTHTVEIFEDGTITVRPSIQTAKYHGWLEHGVWRDA